MSGIAQGNAIHDHHLKKKMSSDGEALILPAPTQTEENLKEDESKVCDTCRVPLKSHPGTPGGIKCLGRVFSNGLQAVLDELSTVRRELENERQEALDREARLSRSIKALQKEVTTKHEEYLEALERIEFLEKEKKARRRGEQDPPRKSKTKPNPEPGTEPAQSWADRTSAQNVPSPSSESGAETEGNKDSQSEEREEDRKREQGNDIPEKIAGEHKPYSRVAQVPVRRLPRSRENQHVQARQRDDRPAWARRTTPPVWDSDDDSWEYVTKKKPSVKRAVLYVGNLDPETTEDRLHEFIYEFWPGRVYARKWHFQEAVQQTKDKEREEAAPELAEGETTELEKTGKSSSAPVEETLQA